MKTSLLHVYAEINCDTISTTGKSLTMTAPTLCCNSITTSHNESNSMQQKQIISLFYFMHPLSLWKPTLHIMYITHNATAKLAYRCCRCCIRSYKKTPNQQCLSRLSELSDFTTRSVVSGSTNLHSRSQIQKHTLFFFKKCWITWHKQYVTVVLRSSKAVLICSRRFDALASSYIKGICVHPNEGPCLPI